MATAIYLPISLPELQAGQPAPDADPIEPDETPPVWMLLFSIGGILAVGGHAGIQVCWYGLAAYLAVTALRLVISTVRGRTRHDDRRAPEGATADGLGNSGRYHR